VRRTENSATLHQTTIRIARDRLANESLIQRKSNSGSARLCWVRENCNHRRTATRQQGFCCSVLKQIPFDFSKTGVLLEDRILKIIQEWTALQAPRESTEPVEFRVSGELCQSRATGLRRLAKRW